VKSYKQIDENKNHPSFPFMDFFRRNRKATISLLAIFVVSFLGILTTFNHADASIALPAYWGYKALTSGFSGAGEAMGNMFVVGIKYILGAILTLVGWLLIIPGIMLDVLLKVENNALYLDSTAVREVWVMVRDFLNLFFIFTLLFSAFATIFQIDKYHIKKIIFKIVIMALLVNFSFPIARFFIDVSNVAMYWMLNNMFGGSGGASIAATLVASSGLKDLLLPENAADYQVPYLIAAIVFTFIFGITLMMIAILFLVRLIALSVIVMFSPIGFVGYVFPDTAKFASQWWDALLKYSFFAPIMTFGLAVTLKMMQSLGANSASMSSFRKAAEDNSTNIGADANWIAAAAFFVVPIVILWLFMDVAQKFSIAGASAVQKKGQDIAKWAGRQPWRGTKALVGATGIPGGIKSGYESFKKRGVLGSDRREEREAKWAERFGTKNAVNKVDMQRIKENGDKHNMQNRTEKDLVDLAEKGGDRYQRAAAIMELAARGKAEKKHVDQLYKKEGFREDSHAMDQFRNKVKAYDPVAAFTKADGTLDEERLKEHINSNQFDAKKLNASSLKDDKFIEMAFNSGAISLKDVEELQSRSDTHKDNIKGSLKAILDRGGYKDLTSGTSEEKEIKRNLHMAYLAQHGEIHSDANESSSRIELFQRADKDLLKRIQHGILTDDIMKEIGDNVSAGKYKDIISNMNRKSQVKLNGYIKSSSYVPVAGSTGESVQKVAQKDSLLENIG